MQLMKKINKEFDERCIKIRNRIQRIKKEEENYQRKIINHRKKEMQDKLIKDDKKKMRIELEKNKEEKNKALNTKKQKIQDQRQKDNIYRENRKNTNLSQKKINYQTSLNDKYLMKIIKEQLNTQQFNKNTYIHAKIRQEYNEFEANKMKRNLEKENQIQEIHENNIMLLKKLEKEMKNTCYQLEELEKEAIDSLNKTKHMNMRIVGSDPYSYTIAINDNKKKKRNNKQINKSMDNVNGIAEIVNGEEKNNHKSDYMKRRIMSPKNKNQKQKQNLNEKNKAKTKYGHAMPISVNSFPKSNKSQSAKKINNKNKTFSSCKNNENKKDIEKNTDKNKEQKHQKKQS